MIPYWVVSGPGFPCGARKLGAAPDGPGGPTAWMDICIMGQHLPQMYPLTQIRKLTADDCPDLGLCPACLGWGDMSTEPARDLLEAARGLDEVDKPCPDCAGSGRPALRITITRSDSGIEGSIEPVPHAYVTPLPETDPQLLAAFEVPADTCLACGMPENGAGPQGEQLHVE